MADTTFNTDAGLTIARENMVAYLNTGTASSPVWSAIGKRVTDASRDYDWSEETDQDILGNTHTTMKKPKLSETFNPVKFDSADSAYMKVWNLAVREQNAQALTSMDMLIVHKYAGSASTPWAERYPESAIKLSSIGGEGGGNIEGEFEVMYGGQRDVGTATVDANGTVTFTSSAA